MDYTQSNNEENSKRKHKRIVFLLVGLTSLVAIGSSAFYVYQLYQPLYEVEKKVKLFLNDPDSAIFENVRVNQKTGAGCGFVNAKNRMGGYVGKTHFIAYKDGTVELAPQTDRSHISIEEKIESIEKSIKYTKLMEDICY